eukprot:4805631-Alexandrium_andersonii.AAC.1
MAGAAQSTSPLMRPLASRLTDGMSAPIEAMASMSLAGSTLAVLRRFLAEESAAFSAAACFLQAS